MTLKTAFALALAMVSLPASAAAPPFETDAPVAYMKDLSSGAVLYAKNPDLRMPPASLAKMMTVYVAFDRINSGKLKLNQTLTVSDETWRKWNNQGSSMFLSPGQQVSVADLLHGIITLSGNDASIVLAEGIAGSEEAFVDMMNREARRIGVRNSHFGTANGWPDEGRTYVTARDLATIAAHTVQDFPDLYRRFYQQTEFRWNGINQQNRDPLLGKIPGADGLKTGHTEEAGYGFTGSAEQNGRRLVMVLAGMKTYNGRIDQSVRFMNWGFRAWTAHPLFRKGATVAEAPVQLGGATHVPLVAPRNLAVTLPAAEAGRYQAVVRYMGPIKAPIAEGQHIADLVVTTRDSGAQVMPLVAGAAVSQAGFFGRVWNGLKSLFGAA